MAKARERQVRSAHEPALLRGVLQDATAAGHRAGGVDVVVDRDGGVAKLGLRSVDDVAKHVSKTGQVLRWAVLTTQNGFAVVGRPSVSVSPENDDEDIGKRIAIDNATNELWPLMGYALKERQSASA